MASKTLFYPVDKQNNYDYVFINGSAREVKLVSPEANYNQLAYKLDYNGKSTGWVWFAKGKGTKFTLSLEGQRALDIQNLLKNASDSSLNFGFDFLLKVDSYLGEGGSYIGSETISSFNDCTLFDAAKIATLENGFIGEQATFNFKYRYHERDINDNALHLMHYGVNVYYSYVSDGDWIKAGTTTKSYLHWDIPRALQDKIPGATEGIWRFKVEVVSDNSILSSYIFTDTLRVSKNDAPTINAVVTDVNSKTQGLTGDANVIVLNASTARVKCNIVTHNGAELYDLKIRDTGTPNVWEHIDFQTQTIDIFMPTTNRFEIYAKDSQGLDNLKVITFPSVNYFSPEVKTVTSNVHVDGTTKFKITGDFFNGSFGATSNTLQLMYRIYEKGADSSLVNWTNVTPQIDENKFSYTGKESGLDYKKSYVFEVYWKDAWISHFEEPVEINFEPIFDWSKNDFNFNVPVTMKYALPVSEGGTGATTAEQARINLGITKDGAPLKVGTSQTLIYPEGFNQINFGGTGTSDIIYFGYKGKDSRPEPTQFYFGSGGDAELVAGNTILYKGSNVNGYYWQWANGLMICHYNEVIDAPAINTKYGNLYFGTVYWSFPKDFVTMPTVTVGCSKLLTTGATWAHPSGEPDSYRSDYVGQEFYVYDAFPREIGYQMQFSATAIGRWK